PPRDRREEPQTVLLDRAAELRAGAIDVLNLRARSDAVRWQVVFDVRALHVLRRDVPVDRSVEGVAADLRDRVERRAARPRLRAHAGRLELHLLDRALVGDVADARRGADEILIPEAVERRARARLSVKERVGALRGPRIARAAHIVLRRR